MKLATSQETHLTYGTDAYPDGRLEDLYRHIGSLVLGVKYRLCPDRPFGVGLRLSARCAEELANPRRLAAFAEFLDSRGLYVFTVNGVDLGPARGEFQTRPDWLEARRLAHADRLAVILAALLPNGMEGTIASLGVAAAARLGTPAKREAAARRLLAHAATLQRVREVTGKSICLALQPEPLLGLDSVASIVGFFKEMLFSKEAIAAFARATRRSRRRAEDSLRRHLGLCLDACHLSMRVEKPESALFAFDAAGIRVPKLRLTCGLEQDWRGGRPARLDDLERFAESGCLQMMILEPGKVRIQVPISQPEVCGAESTQPFLARLLDRLPSRPGPMHLEVEALTWRLLPPERLRAGVIEAVAREMEWVIERVS